MSRYIEINDEEYEYLKSINDTVHQNLNEALKLLEKSNELVNYPRSYPDGMAGAC